MKARDLFKSSSTWKMWGFTIGLRVLGEVMAGGSVGGALGSVGDALVTTLNDTVLLSLTCIRKNFGIHFQQASLLLS